MLNIHLSPLFMIIELPRKEMAVTARNLDIVDSGSVAHISPSVKLGSIAKRKAVPVRIPPRMLDFSFPDRMDM